MLCICWLASCLNWSQCCEATREFSFGFFVASYLPNSGRNWLHLIAVWPPSHFGDTWAHHVLCIDRQKKLHIHSHLNDENADSGEKRCKRWNESMLSLPISPWVCVVLQLQTFTHLLNGTHTQGFGSEKQQDGTSHWIDINIWPERYLHSPLIRGNRWPQGLWTASTPLTKHQVLAVFTHSERKTAEDRERQRCPIVSRQTCRQS